MTKRCVARKSPSQKDTLYLPKSSDNRLYYLELRMLAKRVVVVGGGVAGLTIAHLLAHRCDVTLITRDRRLGGRVYSHTTHLGLADMGANIIDFDNH